MARAKPDKDPLQAYCDGVLSGAIPACRWVRLAVERHLRDLDDGAERGLIWSPAHAQHFLDFCGLLKHSKGRDWAGKQFVPEPWQVFIFAVLFGWLRADGMRRFRAAYVEVPKKNGKSTMCAALGLYLFIADEEPGAEVYCAATKRDQALITWSEAERMVRSSPPLKRKVGAHRNNLHILATNSKMEPLGADADTLDGINPNGLIIDELHAHKTPAVWDVLEHGGGARAQPLQVAITTSGFNRQSVCYEQRDYVTKILERVVEDDSYFGFIATIDEGDDWRDETVWRKANPNYGVSVKVDDLRQLAKRAEQIPGRQNNFRRLRLNEWTEQDTRWLSVESWQQCRDQLEHEDLLGRKCFAGLDLSSTLDLSALVLLFETTPEELAELGKQYIARGFYWVPGDNVHERVRRDRVPYDAWIRDGHIEATSGNVIDYDQIRHRIVELGEVVQIAEIALDRWNATQLSTQLQADGFEIVLFGQGFASMAAPCREMERLIAGQLIGHNGDPVLQWAIANVSIKEDPAGNKKPNKATSTERIDPVVALLMALGRAILHEGEDESPYNTRGIRWLG